MSRACFLTAIDNPEPLNWGLKLEKIAAPMVLLCSRGMAEALKVQSAVSYTHLDVYKRQVLDILIGIDICERNRIFGLKRLQQIDDLLFTAGRHGSSGTISPSL